MVGHKKEDPRAIRSKRMIKKAVVDILIENPDISKLTVQKISKRAELNRATFYLHFLDIDDLLSHYRDKMQNLSTEQSNTVNKLSHDLLCIIDRK